DARRILTEKREELETLARGLLEYETLSGDEIRNLLNGQPPVRDTGEPPAPSWPKRSSVPSSRPVPRRPTGQFSPEPNG
ncbi:MAG TPA: cell division protein FtsH, partial [Microvirga sp.]|nr:cell division protein FtsH [Microvirga sp.]